MSCGRPHELPCTEILDRIYAYLDGELDEADCSKVRQHLDECGPVGRDCSERFYVHDLLTMTLGLRGSMLWVYAGYWCRAAHPAARVHLTMVVLDSEPAGAARRA